MEYCKVVLCSTGYYFVVHQEIRVAREIDSEVDIDLEATINSY